MKKNYVYEEWKDIKGYEGLYQISNFGRVRTYDKLLNHFSGKKRILKGKVLKLSFDRRYYFITLYKEGKRKLCLIHRLVAEAFIPNPNNYTEVNHKGENKTKNYVWQLEWCTHKENCNYGTRNTRIVDSRTGTFRKRVTLQYDMNNNLVARYCSLSEASRQTGLKVQDIHRVVKGNRKSCGGFIWKYE